jgi:hypothetical protein
MFGSAELIIRMLLSTPKVGAVSKSVIILRVLKTKNKNNNKAD